jgi:hypothetical protein
MARLVEVPGKGCTTQEPTRIKNVVTSPLMAGAHNLAHPREKPGSVCSIALQTHIKRVCMSRLVVSVRTLAHHAIDVFEEHCMKIAEVIGLLGLIFGLIGTVIGVFNYLRDRGKLVVRLQWDMAITGEPEDKRTGCITITNTGRRAIFMSHVALRLPKGAEYSHFLIRDGLKGQKLSEGDSPAVFPVDQEGLEPYASEWQKVLAQVSDSTGKVWLSKKVPVTPSWAKTPNHGMQSDAARAPRA